MDYPQRWSLIHPSDQFIPGVPAPGWSYCCTIAGQDRDAVAEAYRLHRKQLQEARETALIDLANEDIGYVPD